MSYALLFLAAVFAEVASLVMMGSWLGTPMTLGLLVLSFGVGFLLLSGRGIATVKNALGATSQGASVTPALIDGALIAVAGILFIIPGFASDAVALVLVLPPVRAVVRGRVAAWLRARVQRLHLVKVPGSDGPIAAGEVIDVDGTEVPDDDQPRLSN